MHDPTIESFASYLDLNEAFHRGSWTVAKSPFLRRTLERVTSLPFASPSALVFARSRLPRAAEMYALGREQHRAIVEAIENRQGTPPKASPRARPALAPQSGSRPPGYLCLECPPRRFVDQAAQRRLE